jgi:hypothetical protein
MATGTIVLDCAVFPGNSGGPAVQIAMNGNWMGVNIIGVVIQYVPTLARILGDQAGAALVNSGYSIVASADHVRALIDKLSPAAARDD